MASKILDVDHIDDAVLVSFEDGALALFESAFLYEQIDKRIKPDGEVETLAP